MVKIIMWFVTVMRAYVNEFPMTAVHNDILDEAVKAWHLPGMQLDSTILGKQSSPQNLVQRKRLQVRSYSQLPSRPSFQDSRAMNGQRNIKEIKEIFQQALVVDASNNKTWNEFGAVGGGNVSGKRYNHVDCFVNALVLDPKNADAWNNLGASGGGTVDGIPYSQAECLQNALNLDPNLAKTWYKLRAATDGDHFVGFATISRRQQKLDEALMDLGVNPADLENDSRLFGTAALRLYRNFVLPKSEEALAATEMPQRAKQVAAEIDNYIREVRAAHATYFWHNNFTDGEDVNRNATRTHPLAIVLDDIRSAHNVGTTFRIADAARCEVVACGVTPRPPNAAVLKAALGADRTVPQRHFGSVVDAIGTLRSEGFTIWAAETAADALSYREQPVPRKLALVVGNEVTGVGPDAIAAADVTVYIPLYGLKNSLNVAQAAAVIVFDILGRAAWCKDAG